MSQRLSMVAVAIVSACLVSVWAAPASLSLTLSQVVAVNDLVSELESKVSQIEAAVVSPESFQASTNQLRQQAIQLAIVAQALAEHDGDSKCRSQAPSIRDAAIQLGSTTSFDQARKGIDLLHLAIEGKGPVDSKRSFDWSRLAKTRTVMDALRERTDHVRKALRRSKDPVAESRQASMMAVLMLAVAAHADDRQEPDRSAWRDWSLECQQELTLTAAALHQQDAAAVLEHFTAAQARCDKCHEKFKK